MITYPEMTGREPCLRVDPERFFPESGRNASATAAANLCRSCPTLLPCLAWAVRNERYGIWGGTTAKQRGDLRRLGRAAA